MYMGKYNVPCICPPPPQSQLHFDSVSFDQIVVPSPLPSPSAHCLGGATLLDVIQLARKCESGTQLRE